MGVSSRSGPAAGRSGSATGRRLPSPPSSTSSPSDAGGPLGSVPERSDWNVAVLLRPPTEAAWQGLPHLDLTNVLTAAGIELTVRGADKLMVRVAVHASSAEEAEARAERKVRDVPCLRPLEVASIRAR